MSITTTPNSQVVATNQPSNTQNSNFKSTTVCFDKKMVQPTPPATPPRQSSLTLLMTSNSVATTGANSNSNTTTKSTATTIGYDNKNEQFSNCNYKIEQDQGNFITNKGCLTFSCPKPDRVERKFQRPLCGTPPPKKYFPQDEDEEDEDEDEDSDFNDNDYDDNEFF